MNVVHIDAYIAAEPSAATFAKVAEPERLPPPPPSFMFGPLPSFLARDLFGQFEVGGLGCYRINSGRLTTHGFVLHGETALWSLALNHPAELVEQVISPTALGRGSLPTRRVPGQAACIYGPGYRTYGHWLVDFLPRLKILQLAGFDLDELTFVLPWDLPTFATEFMRLVGIKDAHIIRHDHDQEQLEFDEIVLPTMLRHANRLHSRFAAATGFWLSRLRSPGEAPYTLRRLFVSRSGVASNRTLGNRVALERIAVSCGFELIYPELLSLPDQISLFRSAGQIVGEYGSALHSTIFSPSSAICVALRGTSHAPGFVQSSLARAFNQRMGYAFGATPEHSEEAGFEIDEGDFRLALECAELFSLDRQSKA